MPGEEWITANERRELMNLMDSGPTKIPNRRVDENLILATWNIQNFGAKKSDRAIQYIADIVERFEMAVTDETLEVACGTIPAGTCGGVRIQCVGMAAGNEAVVVEHVTRMGPKVAPEWPIGEYPITYRIEIEGDPGIRCDMGLSLDDPARAGIEGMTSGAGPMVATAMRVVNAIPYVVAAEPGFLGADDLPLTVPNTAYRAGR